jgi:signal transduction histidine kinase
MAFKVSARVLLQLGAELISSDAIAFYELIKNAFDAQSPKVEVRIVIRIPFIFYKQAIEELSIAIENSVNEDDGLFDIKQMILSKVDHEAYKAEDFTGIVNQAETLTELQIALEESNYISFKDWGTGMSLAELEEIYLTIGTRSRQKERQLKLSTTQNKLDRPLLGEKGIGRLSVMRLGDGLKVKTSKTGEKNFNLLEIDWSLFSHNSDTLIESIDIKPTVGKQKKEASISGTTIYIFKLHTNWSYELVETIVKEQLSKFIDPFGKTYRDFFTIWFNKRPVVVRNLDKILFQKAHAFVEAQFFIKNHVPILSGSIDYSLYKKQKTFSVEGTHLNSIVAVTDETLNNLGPFTIQFYWFNNQIVKEIEGIGNSKQVKKLIESWAGGLMVFRDGFRVNPYGSLDDDWLKLDPKAFGSPGHKVNRRQIIGKVDISSKANPALLDQTNRQGLRDCPEKEALIKILQYILWSEFRTLLDKVADDRITNEPMDLDDIELRLEQSEQKLTNSLNSIIKKYPEIKQEETTINSIRDSLAKSRRIFSDARKVLESYEQRQAVTIHLAGLGLMVDIVAHELNRATEHALRTINSVGREKWPTQTQNLLSTLAAQLKTLQARLKILDPLSPTGRQNKEIFSLNDLVNETFDSHRNQFERHHIKWNLESKPSKEWQVKAVKGMFVQILENLISNSVYWLKKEMSRHNNFKPKIEVFLDKTSARLYFTDNGPGIPIARKEEIFLPFVSTKPPGEGKGLGLYISREIANYHGVSLFLQENQNSPSPSLHTFVLDLSTIK